MNIEKIEKNGTICAVVRSDEIVITDAQSALDLLMTAKYELGTKNIVIDKKRIKEDFFILSSGLAGDILQKMIFPKCLKFMKLPELLCVLQAIWNNG